MGTRRLLLTGAAGQLGTDLALFLKANFPDADILLTDIAEKLPEAIRHLPYQRLDVCDKPALTATLKDYQPTQIYHLAALLSGTAEKNPELAWSLNVDSFKTILDVARQHLPGARIFLPSSIAVYGPSTNHTLAPQKGYLDPTTMYGVTKIACEQLGHYYHNRYGVDVRSLRFPGLLSYHAKPGGGTTDYAVDIFIQAHTGHYNCYLKADTAMPFLFMDDALDAIANLMEAPAENIKLRTSYNLHGFTATPADFAAYIHKQETLDVTYAPDFRQAIADSWPAAMEDADARNDWHFAPRYSFADVCETMLAHLTPAHAH